MISAWCLNRILLEGVFWRCIACECCFQGPTCLATLILATFMLEDLLGVGKLWVVIQRCLFLDQTTVLSGHG